MLRAINEKIMSHLTYAYSVDKRNRIIHYLASYG